MSFDIAIVGGGPVGATVAVALGVSGFKVALIEARSSPLEPTGPLEARVSAVTRASERILRALGVWQHLLHERVGVFREMHVWERSGVGEIHFDAADIAEPCLGFIIENQVLDHALGRRLEALESVAQFRGQRLVDVRIGAAQAVLELTEMHLEAELVVGADGSGSRVRALAGVEVDENDYAQRALVSVVRAERPHRETAWQRFLAGGPIAFLPLPANQCCVVWSLAPADAARLESVDDDVFGDELEAATESRFGRFVDIGPRAAFDLRRLKARSYIAERVALVGDAAHTIHPLAGQGVNLGFYDAAALAEVVKDARAAGRPLHTRSTLRRYERWRRGPNAVMQNTMDFFFTLFGSNLGGIEGLRNLGLRATDRLTPLKRIIMRHASGLEGDLPALAKSEPAARLPDAK